MFRKAALNTVRMAQVHFDTKALGADGKFSGYASVFGNVDRANEIVIPGAFAESLKARKDSGKSLPLCWQHNLGDPIGDCPVFAEDERGLYVEGDLWLEEAPRAKLAYRGMKSGAITGMSIGYRILADEHDRVTGARKLTKLDLIEVSIVTTPANDEAQVEAVKMKLAHGDLPTLSEFERFLREAGFSKSQAACIASKGLKTMLRSESETDLAAKAALGALNARLDAFLSS